MLIERWFDLKTCTVVERPGPDPRTTMKIVFHDAEANGKPTAAARCEVVVHVNASGASRRDAIMALRMEYENQTGRTDHRLLPKVDWSRVLDALADVEGM